MEKEIAKRLGSAATLIDTRYRLDGVARAATRNAFTCAIAALDPGRFATDPKLEAIEADLARRHMGRLA